MFTFKRLVGIGCLTVPFLVAGTVHAEIVTDWNYTLNSTFSAFSPTGNPDGVDGTNPNVTLGGSTTLTWGTEANDDDLRSSLTIDNNGTNSGQVQTGIGEAGVAVDTSIYTHNNYTITGTSLSDATLLDVLTLDPQLPSPPFNPGSGDSFNAPPLVFAIQFLETPNFWDDDTNPACPPGVPQTGGCGDIFVLDVSGAGFNPATLSFVQVFPYAGEIYAASIFLNNVDGSPGLISGSDDACIRAGASPGCVAMVTAEGEANEFQASFSVEHLRTIPEPGVLALMALGLLAMGGLKRKQSAT